MGWCPQVVGHCGGLRHRPALGSAVEAGVVEAELGTEAHLLRGLLEFLGHVAEEEERARRRDGEKAREVGRSGGAEVKNRFGALLKGILRCSACDAAVVPTHTKITRIATTKTGENILWPELTLKTK